jgi:hypothetical protein
MTVYVLLRDIQGEYGYVDTSVDAVFCEARDAALRLEEERQKARFDGLRTCDETADGDWEVAWRIERRPLD